MLPPAEILQDLVLVGGGHAHALALRMLAMRPIEGLRITLVSPASHTPYSGMLPGLVAGHYSFEQTHIDLQRLCRWAGVRFLAAEVDGLSPEARELSLVGRPAINYDLLSIDIGSQPELDSVPGARAHTVPVKPVAGLWQRWEALERRLAAGGNDRPCRVAVVGGGAGSVELVLAMAHRLAGRAVEFDLFCGAESILQGYNPGARGAVLAALERIGVRLHLESRVVEVRPSELVMAEGEICRHDELFWCTGAAAAPWVAASGLATDGAGFLAITDTLQSLDDPRVFGAGDIATQVRHPRPKAGVYAVRQGPVLAHNLRAKLLGKRLKEHRPQQRFLSLVSLGDKQATADRGPFSATGAWVWRWKDRIDRKFMAQFEDLPRSMPLAYWGRLPGVNDDAQQPCGGCGAKVAPDVLGTALGELAARYPGHCPSVSDDAVPVPGATGAQLVQSLDMLRELVADPWLMGRIAANHALSDLHACAARPVSALAAVCLPYASNEIQRRELQQLLAGALHEFTALDCQLTGGHSMQGPELNLGFVVNGVPLSAAGLLPKTGLSPGDHLILTKPLGTGVLFAAAMQLAADGRDIAAALVMMVQSNADAGALALDFKASACTDVTGFGLLGHLLEMLGEQQRARLQLSRLPLLAGVTRALAEGIRSSAHELNASAAAALSENGSSRGGIDQVLFDPQTSGGLLIGIAAERSAELLSALQQSGYPAAAIIGEVAGTDDLFHGQVCLS